MCVLKRTKVLYLNNNFTDFYGVFRVVFDVSETSEFNLISNNTSI